MEEKVVVNSQPRVLLGLNVFGTKKKGIVVY